MYSVHGMCSSKVNIEIREHNHESYCQNFYDDRIVSKLWKFVKFSLLESSLNCSAYRRHQATTNRLLNFFLFIYLTILWKSVDIVKVFPGVIRLIKSIGCYAKRRLLKENALPQHTSNMEHERR